MQPLSLTLKGFRGIRDGLGRDVLTLDFERLADGAELVAIIGAITLTLRRRPDVRRQDIGRQVNRRIEQAVELKKVKTGAGL